MTVVLTWAHPAYSSPYRHLPLLSQCSWTSACGSYDCKVYLSNNYQGTWKKQDLLHTDPGGYTAELWPPSKATDRERVQPGTLHLLWSRVGYLGFCGFPIGECKT